MKDKLDDLLLHMIMVIEKNLKMLHPEVYNNKSLEIEHICEHGKW